MYKIMLRKEFNSIQYSLFWSGVTLFFFHLPFFQFVVSHIDYQSFNGILLILSLVICIWIANAFTYLLFLLISKRLGKILMAISLLLNSIAIYFIVTYHVIIDESMIGNVFNTQFSEASSYFSTAFVLYLSFLGIIPAFLIFKLKFKSVSIKKGVIFQMSALGFLGIFAFANAANWLWIDKNSKQLGGLAMPWSYSVNTALHVIHQNKKNEKEILLPNAKIGDHVKSVVVLVIGESARSKNFSLYGYSRNTNPLLSNTPNLYHFNATSCATYTTAGVKCILEHENTSSLYEILPNYLYRNNVEVIWRTSNWGEPPVHIKNYITADDLGKTCKSGNCSYDEILLQGLKEQIRASTKEKILVVLHTSTSHGPSYNKKYPKTFEKFSPTCGSVELGKCTSQELYNAYDNTIVYTDFLLHSVIQQLKELPEYQSSMIYVSDHGESLGENNLYMHGIPKSLAPAEQYDIPFIVWVSPQSRQVKKISSVTQNYVFHSVLSFLTIQSPIFKENMSIFK